MGKLLWIGIFMSKNLSNGENFEGISRKKLPIVIR